MSSYLIGASFNHSRRFITESIMSDEISIEFQIRSKYFFTRHQFWLWVLSLPASVCVCVCQSVCVCVCQARACPRHNSSRVQAGTTNFGQKMQNSFVNLHMFLTGIWPWPSRSNLTPKFKSTPFGACPCHNSPLIQARTTKFGPKMQTNLVMLLIVLVGDWHWLSGSNFRRNCKTYWL